jgi:4-diphosphocytidyl-2-C-methyl-D-erythritol kinase
MKFHLRSSAKVNLSLDILSQRADGYHELASVVHTIGIWDDIDIEITETGPISFSCNRDDLAGEDNLCVKTLHQWNKETGQNLGAKIHLEKKIPTGAGLGGGSGNAAAILLALNRAAPSPLPAEALNAIGATLGADVPLFLEGGAVLMEGIGERLTPLASLEGWLLVVKPEISFSTPSIYRAWDGGGFASVRGSEPMLRGVAEKDLKGVAVHLSNDLERAAAQISDVPQRLVQLLMGSGALGAQMSGSGSACFGLFETETQVTVAKENFKSELAKDVHLSNSQIFVAPLCERGVEVAP